MTSIFDTAAAEAAAGAIRYTDLDDLSSVQIAEIALLAAEQSLRDRGMLVIQNSKYFGLEQHTSSCAIIKLADAQSGKNKGSISHAPLNPLSGNDD